MTRNLILVALSVIVATFLCRSYLPFATARTPMPAPPEVERTGLDFTNALVAGDYKKANFLLTPQLAQQWPPDRLKDTFERMTLRGVVTQVEGEVGYADYPNKPPGDLGGVYIAVLGHQRDAPVMTFSEAVMVFVRQDPEGPRIRQIIWGRP